MPFVPQPVAQAADRPGDHVGGHGAVDHVGGHPEGVVDRPEGVSNVKPQPDGVTPKYGQRVRIPTVGGGLAPAFAQADGRPCDFDAGHGDVGHVGDHLEGVRDQKHAVDLALVPLGVHGAAGEHAYEGEGHGQAAVGVHATVRVDGGQVGGLAQAAISLAKVFGTSPIR